MPRGYNQPMLNDTHPEAERVHIRLLREAGQTHRSSMASGLTNRVVWQSRQALAQTRPDLSEVERNILWVKLHYGPELAERVSDALAVQTNG